MNGAVYKLKSSSATFIMHTNLSKIKMFNILLLLLLLFCNRQHKHVSCFSTH